MKLAPSSRFARAAGLVVTGALAVAAPASADEGRILRENADNAIPGSYVVVLDEAHVEGRPTDEIRALSAEYGAEVEHRYANAVQGFSAEMSREDALALSADPAVKYVQQDQVFETTATQAPTPSWGLDRIDQRTPALNNQFTYPDTQGRGVTAYVIDTGILTTHNDFGGRALWGTNTTGDGRNTDCNGHGRTSRARSAARPTASPRASRSSPSKCSTAAAAAPSPASWPVWTGSPRTIRPGRPSRT